MNVLLDDDETVILESAGEFLAAESTPAVVRAAEKDPARYSKALWKRFAALGWLGISLPEDCGGQGLPQSYMGLVFEELGRHMAPLPVHATLVPALVIARHGTQQQKQDLLPRVIDGSLMLAWALPEADGRWATEAIALTGRIENGEVKGMGAALVDVAPPVPLGYTHAQMHDLVQMAVNATLAGLQQATGGPAPKGAPLTLVAQPEPRGRSQLQVVR